MADRVDEEGVIEGEVPGTEREARHHFSRECKVEEEDDIGFEVDRENKGDGGGVDRNRG